MKKKSVFRFTSMTLIAVLLCLSISLVSCSDISNPPSDSSSAAPIQSPETSPVTAVKPGMTFGEVKEALGYGEIATSGVFFVRQVNYTTDDGSIMKVTYTYTADDYAAFMKEIGITLSNNELLPEVFEAFTGNPGVPATSGITEEQLARINEWVSADKVAKVELIPQS
ncbi:MAG: hypothetical protein MJ137_01160 [Clostridia bacterium]|nr:hypothetical protein [Clostridia bacterium]